MNNRILMIPVFAILAIQVSTASGNCPPPCNTADETSPEFVGPPMINDTSVPDVANVGPVFAQFRCLGNQLSIGNPPVCPIDFDDAEAAPSAPQLPERKVSVSQGQMERARALILSASRDLIPNEIRQQLTDLIDRTIDAVKDMAATLDKLEEQSSAADREENAALEITFSGAQQSPDTRSVDSEEGEVCMAIPVCDAETPSMCQLQ